MYLVVLGLKNSKKDAR